MTKNKRNEKIKELLISNITYQKIGKRFSISKQRVMELAEEMGLASRHEKKRVVRKLLSDSILKDFNSDMPLRKIRKKYKMSTAEINYIVKINGKTLNQIELGLRNNRISNKFSVGNTAMSLTKSKDTSLTVPTKIMSVSGIYRINKINGVKRYPQIISRYHGGCFEDKKILRFIKRNRDKGLTFREITEQLNTKGVKTVCGKAFWETNVHRLYNIIN